MHVWKAEMSLDAVGLELVDGHRDPGTQPSLAVEGVHPVGGGQLVRGVGAVARSTKLVPPCTVRGPRPPAGRGAPDGAGRRRRRRPRRGRTNIGWGSTKVERPLTSVIDGRKRPRDERRRRRRERDPPRGHLVVVELDAERRRGPCRGGRELDEEAIGGHRRVRDAVERPARTGRRRWWRATAPNLGPNWPRAR